MKNFAKMMSLITLCMIVVPCSMFFAGAIELPLVKSIALFGTIGWFIFTPIWMSRQLPIDAAEVEI
ncbi:MULTISPECIES: hypothetical protein [Rhodopirellula]|uniref:hypothetical protein n=1 Tax=Rhodopirellula TaxID=265488 RepID=UPI00257D21AF|nr:hypothetical protein [Rhodopirellula sp. UBA1907]